MRERCCAARHAGTHKEYRARQAASARKRRAANPEAERERRRKRYAANPEAERERSRKWYAANPEAERERSRKYRAANLEAVHEQKRKRYATDPMVHVRQVLWQARESERRLDELEAGGE